MEATAAPTRVASWNIGEKGLAALAAATPGGLGALFEGQLSRPDIVCLQETKLSGPDKLTSELANVPGYTSYFAFCRAATGGSLVRASYAGTATYVRHGVPTLGTDLGHEFGPFAADAAMQSVRGVPLPIYRAFQLLRDAGDTVLPVATTGTGAGFEQSGPLTVMATKNASDLGLRVFLSNFARLDGNATPERPAANSSRTVQLTVLCPTRSPGAAAATVRTINSTCANPKAVWIDEMQSVPWPSAAQLDKLRVASRVCEDEVRLRWANASPARAAATLEVRLEAFAVAEVSLRC